MIVGIVVAIGILLKYFMFRKESENRKSNKFIKSKLLLEFMVDIIIIFLGHFISMGITEWDNERKEKENVISMLEQACDFAQEQYNEHFPYLDDYNSEDLSIQQLEIYTTLDFEYFKNVVSNDAVIRHLDTHTYGVFCKYINYLEVIQKQIDAIDYEEADSKHQMMYLRAAFYGRLIRVLDICTIEVSEDLTEAERDKLIEILNEEKIQSYPIYDNAEQYLIDRNVLDF